MKGFYQVKFNKMGMTDKVTISPSEIWAWTKVHIFRRSPILTNTGKEMSVLGSFGRSKSFRQSKFLGALAKTKEQKRTVLIGTMEYDIEDWKIKVKIGGLGVMAQLMGKALGHIDLIWVIPCVGGIDYPIDTPAEPMKATVLGIDYSVSVQYHKVKNITYVLLDAPVFRQQTQAEPYPARMDDLTSAIYYSAWNQCIAQAIKRFPIDMYHINDYHGCIAPLYLLPSTIPVCLSLHNAEFQGLWPMRNSHECTEVSRVFNLTTDVVQKFVQFGEVFNMLHAGASYLRVYQGGFGAVGVSKKYGRRAHLRYPIFWGLRKVGQLPNPDPTDTAAWDGKLPRDVDMAVDNDFEAQRPELRLEAQRWAGLEENADAELFVFVGRWSMQKGIDLIADVFPSILKKHPNTQLICIGPVIDLYGKFAALKLEKLMEKYPTRVCSKPVFTQLPPCIFSGAEFALIPSRDEPFGLVAVEFGRKGALGVGARVGGLGNMPGWWYTVEAVTTQHLLDQFRQAIEEALASQTKLRALMRARSAKQRFPVAQWVEDLDILQTTAMRVHGKKSKGDRKPKTISQLSTASTAVFDIPMEHLDEARIDERLAAYDNTIYSPLATPPVIATPSLRRSGSSAGSSRNSSPGPSTRGTTTPDIVVQGILSPGLHTRNASEHDLLMPTGAMHSRNMSMQSLPSYRTNAKPLASNAVIGERKDYFLQQVDPFFIDTQGTYYDAFSQKLDKSSEMSEGDLCIEQYLEKSEKDWFQMRLNAKLGRESRVIMPAPMETRFSSRAASAIWSFSMRSPATSMMEGTTGPAPNNSNGPFEDFLLGENYKAPRYLRNWMQLRIYDWPLYSFLLALGQIMAANSYQITLLTGQIGQEAERVYTLCAIYFTASIIFWILFRRMQSATLLSIPFGLYGLAFFFIGVAHFAPSISARGWLQNTSSGLYTAASASGSLYFSLNFGDEGGSTVRSWIFRACAIQGTQQIYIAALWFWGAYLSQQSAKSLTPPETTSTFLNSGKITAVCMPIAILLWGVGAAVYYGLPAYYRQIPGRIPSFYQSILRRKIIAWFFVTVLIQNFFLSSQYGRSWMFLWTSQHLTFWHIACLVLFFFIVVWIVMLSGFSYMSKSHSWLLPILAIGLGAPRWAQIWWGVSGMGAWLPWTNSFVASALASRALWLWLGLLDTIQSIGIGMILLSTMTRIHVAFTLISAQAAGSVMTAIARACAPNNVGPGPIFPNVLISASVMLNAWFWIGLLLNCSICIGFFMFFRKEQLSKP
jgi:alpha-1,3-glucan synthase